MKVKQLLNLLQNVNPEKEVLIGPDREDWYYEISGFNIASGRIDQGRLTEEEDPNPVVLINPL